MGHACERTNKPYCICKRKPNLLARDAYVPSLASAATYGVTSPSRTSGRHAAVSSDAAQ